MKYYIVETTNHTGTLEDSQKVVSKYPITYYDNKDDFDTACIDKSIELDDLDELFE